MIRVYFNKVKQWALDNKIITSSGVGGTLVGILFLYLSAVGAIEITGYSEDVICSGTIDDPCYAYINFTAKEDIFIYPLQYDPYNRNVGINFDPNIEGWKLYRSWGTGWREIDLNKSCTGTWCGASNNKGGTFSVAFREGRDYQLRIEVIKVTPDDNVKWSFGPVDPTFYGLNDKSLNKVYDLSNRELSFNSKIDDTNQMKIKLDTEQVHSTLSGKNRRVAITTIQNNYGNYPYSSILGSVEFIKIATNETFTRKYHYEYKKSIGFKTVNDYDEICVEDISNLSNGTTIKNNNCVKFFTGTHQEELFKWVVLNTSGNMPKGNITIALVTDVYPGDRVEWIPTYLNIESKEFASWTPGLNNGLVTYVNLSNTLADMTPNGNDFVNQGGTFIDDGIINGAINFTNDHINSSLTSSALNGANELTFSFWFNMTNFASSEGVLLGDYGVGLQHYQFYFLGTNLHVISDSTSVICDTNGPDVDGGTTFNANQWYHFVFTSNTTSNHVWIDGTQTWSATCVTTGTYSDEGPDITFGNNLYGTFAYYLYGAIDEIAVWNRTLTDSEIATISSKPPPIYTNSFNNAPQEPTLVFPVNISNETTIVTFTVNATDGEDSVFNVSIYGNWTGSWKLNTTNSSALNNTDTNFTISNIPFGTWLWGVNVTDSEGLTNFSINYTVFINKPTLSVFSPTNVTYTTDRTIYFNATNNTDIDNWIVNYNGTNVTLSSINTTLEVEDGNHQLLLYANNNSGPFGLNDSIFFTMAPKIDWDYNVSTSIGFIRFLQCSPDSENSTSLPEGQSPDFGSINITNNGTLTEDFAINLTSTTNTNWTLYASNQSDLTGNITLSSVLQTIYSALTVDGVAHIWLYANCSFVSTSNPGTSININATEA